METLVVVEVAAEGGLPAKFPSDFKWQKLALSAPLKPRKVAMHPRFTTPERLTPSYALVGGRGGEKILRYYRSVVDCSSRREQQVPSARSKGRDLPSA